MVSSRLVELAHLLLFFFFTNLRYSTLFCLCFSLYLLLFSSLHVSMALPIKNPTVSGSADWNISYRIETINLSYKILGETKWFQDGGSSSTRGSKFILKNVNCEANAGEMTAIVGPSGAGKTTLLEILGGKASEKNISGQVLVNDQPVNDKRFQRILGYVTQDDALFPLLTVEETLMYSALLRLHGGEIERVSRVRELVKELGLEKVAASKIGRGSNWGISGGERRRVSIGIDLVHDPPVILIDEPTSGLDSASALHVISVLKRMTANQGKTIVLTIHQPGFRIIQLFDRLVLLSNGFVVHNDSLNCLEERLRLAGHIIPHHVNALEYSMDVLDSLAVHSPAVSFKNPSFLQDNTTKSSFPSTPFSYANPQIKEILILGQRFCRNIFRTKQLFATRIIQASVAGLILGTIFLNNGNEHGKIALQTRLGFFAFSLTFLLSSTTEGLPIFLQERRIIMEETSRGAYRISSYVLANTLVFLPFLLMVSIFYATPVYWLVGLRKEIFSFLYFCLVVWMVVLMSNSLVACCSALVPNFIMGTSVIAGLMGSFFLFSGYFISKQNIPNYWIFMHYLSLFKYPFECFMINEYGGEEGRRRKCIEIEEGQCRLYGGDFLAQQGLKESQKWSNLAVMLGFIIGYRVLSFLILWYRSCRNNRN